MKSYLPVLMILTMICLDCSAQTNSDQGKQSEYQKLKFGIDSKQFHFIPTSVTNSKGTTVQLSGTYFLFLGVDSLTVSLPFFVSYFFGAVLLMAAHFIQCSPF